MLRMRLAGVVVCGFALAAIAFAQRDSESLTADPALRFRYMGPESAGRISAVVGIPGNSSIYSAGAASGGVWKTTDGAKTFEPVFDAGCALFARTGALMAKNAAETIRKVWTCLLFIMLAPVLIACAAKLHPM